MLGCVPWKTEIRTNAEISQCAVFDTNIAEFGLFVRMVLLYVACSLDVTRTLGIISCVGRTGRCRYGDGAVP